MRPVRKPTAQENEEGKGHTHQESPKSLLQQILLGRVRKVGKIAPSSWTCSPCLRSAVATGRRRRILIHIRIFGPALRLAVRVLPKRDGLSLRVTVVIEETSVSATCWREDSDSRVVMTGTGADQKTFAVEKGEMKLDENSMKSDDSGH